MGLFCSLEDTETLHKIQELQQQKLCKFCIKRYLNLDQRAFDHFCGDQPENFTCSSCMNILSHLNEIKSIAKKATENFFFNEIHIELPPKVNKSDSAFLQSLSLPDTYSIRKCIRTELCMNLNKSYDGPSLVIAIKSIKNIQCSLRWPKVFISGRYFKFSRRVSHSKFFRGASISSVEEELRNCIPPEYQFTSASFQSAGREDVDVRMIGTGRPFVLTLSNLLPLSPVHSMDEYFLDLKKVLPNTFKTHNGVTAEDVKLSLSLPDVNPKDMKQYKCVVFCSNFVERRNLLNLNKVFNLVIHQKTPMRVAHRRADEVRQKVIQKLDYEEIDSHFFMLVLTTSGGTYIKEFVNSDFGRTQPHLGYILNPDSPFACELIQLDVISVG